MDTERVIVFPARFAVVNGGYKRDRNG